MLYSRSVGTQVALDLGTSNVVLAALHNGRPKVLTLRNRATSMPAAVAVDERGRWVVGREAKSQLLSRPKDTVMGMKTLMGRPTRSTGFRNAAAAMPFTIAETDGVACAQVGGVSLPLVDAAAAVIREARGQAQDNLGQEISRAIVPVPDYFTDAQRDAFRSATQRAGIPTVRIVDQSEALTSLVEKNNLAEHAKIVFLFGLGGGVFDATLLERLGGEYEVMATTGEDLGGVHIDREIARHLHSRFLRAQGMQTFSDPVGLQRILEAAEAVKIRMDTEDDALVSIPFLCESKGEPVALDDTLDRRDLERASEVLLQRCIAVCSSVMRVAGVSAEQIDAVFLHGRPCASREIQLTTARFFQQSPVVLPEGEVALGAAMMSL